MCSSHSARRVTVVLPLIVVALELSAFGQMPTPALVFDRIIDETTRPLKSLAGGNGIYWVSPPGETGSSGQGSVSYYDEHDWLSGTGAVYFHNDAVADDYVDALVDGANIVAISPDDNIVADVTGQFLVNFWNEATQNAASNIFFRQDHGNWNTDGDPEFGTLYRIVDPDPTDATVPPSPAIVTGSYQALWGFSGAVSEGNMTAGWFVQGGAGVTGKVNVSTDPFGGLWVNGEWVGSVDWNQDGITVEFEFEVQENEVIEVNHWHTTQLTSGGSNGEVIGGGAFTWGFFLTLDAEP